MERFHTVLVTDQEGRTVASFTVPRRYRNLRFINAGAQGTVVSAFDSTSKIQVAIKKMHQPVQKSDTAVNALREFAILSSLKHPCIINIFSVLTPQESENDFEDIYMVTEFMPFNLNQVIKQIRMDHKTLSKFIYQIICGVNHLHREGIIHRDIKPSNIVINENFELKVLDFGLARLFAPTTPMTRYVVTRHYRAPEIIMELNYTEKVDVWSIGCIFAEMITGQILFEGEDIFDQWSKIVKVMGSPCDNFINQLSRTKARFIRSQPRTLPIPLEEILLDNHFIEQSDNTEIHWTASDARRLLSKMLVIDPEERSSLEDILHDPYIAMWCKDEEVNAPLHHSGVDIPRGRSLQTMKSIIFNEVKRMEAAHDVFGGVQ